MRLRGSMRLHAEQPLRFPGFVAIAVLLLAIDFGILPNGVAAVHPIVIQGKHFWDSVTGEEFVIKGMAYQPRENDVIIDPVTNARSDEWMEDVKLMKTLGVNAIRVYEVDPDQEHDQFMNFIAKQGMYLILDLGRGKSSIDRNKPSYTLDLLEKYKAAVDVFAGYDNTLAFFAGNEVANAVNTTKSAPYVKALIRDLKAHMRTKPRYIPVGYSSNDDADIRLHIRDYFNCGDEADRADFLGVNLYSWCGPGVTFESSGYADRTREFADYSIPAIISEEFQDLDLGENGAADVTVLITYICETTQVKTIYGQKMSDVFSGAVFYEFTEESNHYGLVDRRNGKLKKLQDFTNFKQQMDKVDIKPRRLDAYKVNYTQPRECPALSGSWEAVSVLPPTPNECVCNTMMASLSCVASLNNPSSSHSTSKSTQDKVSKLIGVACGMLSYRDGDSACADISPGDGSKGNYGVFSYCRPDQQLSYAYNQYFVQVGSEGDVDACDFKGTAKRVAPRLSLTQVQ
ncbi:1,3-beta-glucanosyltransferase gas1, partial [Quaeritorhiza haematococci]